MGEHDEESTEGVAGGQLTHAPARVEPAVSVSARVAECVALMRSGEYVRGKTDKILAARWGVDPITARHTTAEASRLVRAAIDATAERVECLSLTDEAAELLREAAGLARQAEDPTRGAAELTKAAAGLVAVAKERSEITGVKKPATLKVQPVAPEAEEPKPFWESEH